MKYIITGAVIYILFFIMCYLGTGSDKKNMNSYYAYPDAIQKKISEDSELKALIPKQKNYFQSFISNFILFFAAFVAAGFIVKCFDFRTAFFYLFFMGEGLNLFDFVIIDCCWFVRAKRTRFNNIGTPEMYMGYKKHFISFLKAVPIFAAAAFAAAAVLSFFLFI